MIVVAESVYDGTWSSGPVPAEITDFELMSPEGMGWSWPELQATPSYVRRFSWDLLQIRRRAEADRIEKTRRKGSSA